MFISFEGPEGAGKSTQVQRLAASLRADGRTVCIVREPGSTAIGERIRCLLLTPTVQFGQEPEADVTDRAEVLLFLAARAQLVDEVVKPALERGDVVLADRFSDSTRAYQISGRGLPGEQINQIIGFATDGLEPDLTFLLDLDATAGLSRKGGSGDRLERQDLAFHERVRTAYRDLQRQNAQRMTLIDALRPPEEIAARIRAIVGARLLDPGLRDIPVATESSSRLAQEGDSGL